MPSTDESAKPEPAADDQPVPVPSGLDAFQRKHPVIGFPIAVIYKFFDDQGNYLAAVLSYYAFIAIFPLMLLGTSILGLILQGRPGWQDAILNSALAQFPIIGDELGRPSGLQGSVGGVVIGFLAALYGAMGLAQAVQNTMHVAWSVPRNSRPNPFYARVKSLILLLTAGVSLLAVSIVSTVVSTTDLFAAVIDEGLKDLLPIVTMLVVGAFLTVLFRFAATGQHSLRRAAPGGFALAVEWQVLQILGATYVERVLVGTTSMTKTFGLVLGLVGFIYLGSVMAVLAMEINVVIARRLYPRALLTPFTDNVLLTAADRRAYRGYARMQRHKGFEQVDVRFGPSPAETGELPLLVADARDRPAETSVPAPPVDLEKDPAEPPGQRQPTTTPEPARESAAKSAAKSSPAASADRVARTLEETQPMSAVPPEPRAGPDAPVR